MFDPIELINRNILYPLYFWKNGDKRLSRLQDLESQQYLKPKDLAALQLKKLQDIITYAYQHTQYYRRIMDARGITPADIRCLQDVEKLPLLTKKIIQQHGAELVSDQYNKTELFQDASGGSTGEPTVFYKDLSRHNLRRADQLRHDRWSGWDIGKRSALIWGADRDLKALKSLREFIISRFIARIWELDAFELTDSKMNRFVKLLEKIKPVMILGYANALGEFSRYILKNHPDHSIKLAGIISSAETLTAENRKIIERAFGCDVFNRYGSREVGLIASECKEHQGLHINADNILLEVTHEERGVKKGEAGDIVITDFTNKGMPLIRYQLGDRGVLAVKPCSCPINLPLLERIEGRSSDFFVSKAGKLIHGEFFTHLFYGIKEIKKFQLIQHSLDDLELKLVADENEYVQLAVENIKAKINQIMEDEVNININYLENIAPSPSGKFLFTLSKIHC